MHTNSFDLDIYQRISVGHSLVRLMNKAIPRYHQKYLMHQIFPVDYV